jgi:hypothetical protein
MIVLYEHTRANGPLAQGLGPKINELVHLGSSYSFAVMLVLDPEIVAIDRRVAMQTGPGLAVPSPWNLIVMFKKKTAVLDSVLISRLLKRMFQLSSRFSK